MAFVHIRSRAQFFHDDPRRVGRVGSWSIDVGFHSSLDQPACVPASEPFIIDDAHRARSTARIFFGQILPHLRAHDGVSVSVTDAISVQHDYSTSLRLYVRRSFRSNWREPADARQSALLLARPVSNLRGFNPIS